MSFIEIFLLLVWAHFLADYPLQGAFLARGKNRTAPIEGIPFWHPLTAHSVIHGGFAGLITSSVWLGLGEAVIHWVTDDMKCRGKIGYSTDQGIHIACKLLWACLAVTLA